MLKTTRTLPLGWILLLCFYLALIGLILVKAYQGILPQIFFLPWYDKIGHFMLLGMLAFLVHRACGRCRFRLGRWQLPLAPIVVFALVLVEEGLQMWSPYRTFSLWDLLADSAGIFTFWWLDRKIEIGDRRLEIEAVSQ